MGTVLIVEDSKTFAALLRRTVVNAIDADVEHVASYAEAEELFEEEDGSRFEAALLDLNLPDAPDGQIVELIRARDIPAIVFTGELDDEMRTRVWSRGIVDYIFKEGGENLGYIAQLLQNLRRNKKVTALVVDDSSNTRSYISNLLRIRRYNVLEAADGVEALDVIRENDDVRLVITDYNMPNMDGFQLTREIRKDFTKQELAIIGISGEGSQTISARFIKAGTNDFVSKPFVTEELYCRIHQNMEMLDLIDRIRELSEKDHLTKLPNRMCFFEQGGKLYGDALENNAPMAVVMVDADHFKAVNDTYGHDTGDDVLRFLARKLSENFSGNEIVARFGGEEFCALCQVENSEQVHRRMDALRQSIADATIVSRGQELSVTVSIGVCVQPVGDLDASITCADKMLYEAKNAGRNQVMMHVAD